MMKQVETLRKALVRFVEASTATLCMDTEGPINMGPILRESDISHIELVLALKAVDDVQAKLVNALTLALAALEGVSSDMTVGERYTDAGQSVLDALGAVREALDPSTKE